jgi:hypothetical protein
MVNEFGDSSKWQAVSPEGKVLEVLEDCRYPKVLLPLDYPPSRETTPRWGMSRAPHQGITNLFNRDAAGYFEIFESMRSLTSKFNAISPVFQGGIEPGWYGGAINPLDLAMLYYFVAHYRPQRYVEIGSGLTTLMAARATRDFRLQTRIISIDPEPRNEVSAVCHENIRIGLENLTDMSIFESLQPGDIVFMDGSHRSFLNSDVTVFMLDVLPLLKPGVLIHFHDIALPFDYHPMFLNWHWNEQYIVGVYLLAAAHRIEILMPCEYICRERKFKSLFETPLVDSATLDHSGFKSGGSLWFTHRF